MSVGKTISILSRLSSRLILNVDKLKSALLYIDTFKNILLAKSAILFSYNTSHLI